MFANPMFCPPKSAKRHEIKKLSSFLVLISRQFAFAGNFLCPIIFNIRSRRNLREKQDNFPKTFHPSNVYSDGCSMALTNYFDLSFEKLSR
jgi:hypothetical protein